MLLVHHKIYCVLFRSGAGAWVLSLFSPFVYKPVAEVSCIWYFVINVALKMYCAINVGLIFLCLLIIVYAWYIVLYSYLWFNCIVKKNTVTA